MPVWSRIAVGTAIAVALLAFAGFQATSHRLAPVIGTYGTTYYNGEEPKAAAVPCKPESTIRAAIARVHAKFDHFAGDQLRMFEQRAAILKGLPPLRVDTLYVITEDDMLHDGESVLFIGLTADCVTTVFSFPAVLYRELANPPANAS